jgi:hemolysin III
MMSPEPIGVSRRLNRGILTATLAFGAAGLLVLLLLAAFSSERHSLASIVYGASLLLCSLCSYLYNMRETARRRRLLRHLDHAGIFALIAGSYTPFSLGVHGPFGLYLLAWVWGLALAGMALKILLLGSYERLFVGLYLLIGWLFVSAIDELLAVLTAPSLALIVVAGIAYTVGALIYARGVGRWTDPVWHGCVLAGSLMHFTAVIVFILGAGSA